MTLNFWRMCTANLLLFISVYMLFPLLPFVMGEQLGVSVGQAGSMFLVFVVAMFAVGPFHAYLVDEYKRKHVLLYSALIMLAAVLGYAFVDGYTKFLLLAAVQGACFGLATTAGITVAIDITTSARRSAGNMVYAWAARLGMLVGVVLGIGMYKMYGFRMVTYLSVAAGLASIFFASRGICGFPCSDRRVVVQYGPLLIAACMGTCHQYATDCFCTGSVAATDVCGRLLVIGGIGCIGVHYSPVHEDVRQAVAPLPAWNGKHHLSFVYGGRAAGGHGCGLPPDGQSADIPCGVCCCYACRIFLCTADLSLL